jgi:hypothetical protein
MIKGLYAAVSAMMAGVAQTRSSEVAVHEPGRSL